MNELIKANDTMTSLQIAEIVGSHHKDMLRAIRRMEESWMQVTGRKFSLSEYKDKSGRVLPMYLLDKEESLYVASKFKDVDRAKLVVRWKELELEKRKQTPQEFQLPQTFSQALLLAAQQAEQIEKQQLMLTQQNEQINALEDKVEQMNSKVSYLDKILQNQSTVVVTQIAQDYGMSAKQLNRLLHDMGIQYKINDQWILYKAYMVEGYVHSKQIPIDMGNGRTKLKMLTEWTQKGRLFLYNKLKDNGILPLIER